MIKNLFIVVILITTSGCAKTTFIRSAPSYWNTLTKDKVALLLPPKVEVYQVDALSKKTRVHNYEDKLEDDITDIFIDKIYENKGYKVRLLSKREIGSNKLSKYVLESKDELDDVLKLLYKDGGWQEDVAYSINYTIPQAVDLGKATGADLIFMLTFHAESKTSGAVAKDIAKDILIGVLTGRTGSSSDTSEYSLIRLAIIDALTGKVLWTNSVSTSKSMISTTIDSFSNNSDADKQNLSVLFNSALAELVSGKY